MTDTCQAAMTTCQSDQNCTALLSCLQGCDTTAGIARDWSQAKIVRALTSLAKQGGSGVKFVGSDGRYFKITKPKE